MSSAVGERLHITLIAYLRRLPDGTPANIHTHLTFLETRIIGPHLAADTVGLPLLKFFWRASKLFYFCKSDISAVQGHSRSLILVPIESAYAITC